MKKDQQGLTDYEAALLDTVARILSDELSQLEKPGPVDEKDVARFLQSAKVAHYCIQLIFWGSPSAINCNVCLISQAFVSN